MFVYWSICLMDFMHREGEGERVRERDRETERQTRRESETERDIERRRETEIQRDCICNTCCSSSMHTSHGNLSSDF